MIEFVWVAAGGALGSVLRYGAALFMLRFVAVGGFPWATLLVNITGSFLIGIFTGLFAASLTAPTGARLFMIIGVLGGFTTFSAFSIDSLLLLQKGEWVAAGAYILGSVLISLAAAAFGLWITKGMG